MSSGQHSPVPDHFKPVERFCQDSAQRRDTAQYGRADQRHFIIKLKKIILAMIKMINTIIMYREKKYINHGVFPFMQKHV